MWSSKPPFNVCKSATCKTEYLQVKLIEYVFVREGEDVDKVLWEMKKYWQAQLFTLTHGLNNMNEWYALNKGGCRKQFHFVLLYKAILCHEN